MKTEIKLCCLCKKKIKGYGNNAQPLKDGDCCDKCNEKVLEKRWEILHQEADNRAKEFGELSEEEREQYEIEQEQNSNYWKDVCGGIK